MHNKAMVCDDHSCVVGGRNIGDEYFGLRRSIGFDDIDILATGEAAPPWAISKNTGAAASPSISRM